MPVSYYPILLMIIAAVGFCVSQILISYGFAPHSYNIEKMAPYESGMRPRGSARLRFSVKFFLVAMLFIVFDIESVYLFPWAVLLNKLGFFGFMEMVFFLGVLILGLAYIWRKGGLEWD